MSILWGCSLLACSFIEFEPSPYAPRSLDAIYSAQENLTFLFWRLDNAAEINKVVFEYFDPQIKLWKPINLSRAIYPATPRECGKEICFQYQLPGKVTWEESAASQEGLGREINRDERGVRSILIEENVIFGPLDLRQREVEQTFDIDPVAINRNINFDPQRFDYFDTVNLVLKRNYEWRLTPSTAMSRDEHIKANCRSGNGSWDVLSNTILPRGWTGNAHCMEMRPVTNLIVAESVLAPLPPSALLQPADLNYIPPRVTPVTFFFSLNDLLIRSSRRCNQIRDEIVQTLRSHFTRKTPTSQQVDLGDWFPITPVTEEEYTDCDQPFDRVYPTTEILDEIKAEILRRSSTDQVVVAVYTNNNDDLPPDQVLNNLRQLLIELYNLPNTRIFLFTVTGLGVREDSLGLPSNISFEYQIPWRAREVTPFDEQMDAIATTLFPFHTVLFEPSMTPIPLSIPPESDPLEFKICALTPNRLLTVSVEGEGSFAAERFGEMKSYPWGMISLPELFMSLIEQKRVTDYELVKEKVVLRYEVCEGFCDYPFINQQGTVFPSWSAEVTCQRQERP